MAGIKRRSQCQFINQTTAGAINDPHAFFGFVQSISADDIPRGIGQRCMNGDKISPAKQFVKIDLFNP